MKFASNSCFTRSNKKIEFISLSGGVNVILYSYGYSMTAQLIYITTDIGSYIGGGI